MRAFQLTRTIIRSFPSGQKPFQLGLRLASTHSSDTFGGFQNCPECKSQYQCRQNRLCTNSSSSESDSSSGGDGSSWWASSSKTSKDNTNETASVPEKKKDWFDAIFGASDSSSSGDDGGGDGGGDGGD